MTGKSGHNFLMHNEMKHVFFIGIGGIGMSALARYFNAKGYSVAGYDRAESDLTKALQSEGISIHYEDNLDLIPDGFKDKDKTLVVVTPAVPQTMGELVYFKQNGFSVMKRSQVLGAITRAQRGICVAGTHGKTTTSTMTAHLLHNSHVDCNAFLGGISKNFKQNLHLSDKSDLVVIEADEYDHSFLTLSPYMAVITAVDADHLDVYGTEALYREGFEDFTALIRPDGVLLMKKGLPIHPHVQEGVKIYTYSIEEGDYHAENIRTGNGDIVFDFVTPQGVIKDIKLGVPVRINIENGIAAMALALMNGATPDEIRAAMATFAGVKRRFDFHIKRDDLVFMDDYAHHPQELKSCIESIRALYKDKRICGVFQPHLYTRTRDFADDFARSLSLLDEVVLLDIYPAREKPIPGVTSQMLLDKITIPNKRICTKEELLEFVKTHHFEVLLAVGAGDIDLMIPKMKEILLFNVA
mgnify:CR=1 FL=1|jgi:UDP-N-acetylmuramate--alanine ligase